MEATDLQTELIKTVLAIATPVIVSLVSAVLYKILQRFGLSLDAERRAKLEYDVRQVILRVDEWAAARIKAKVGTTTAAMKLEKALADLTAKVPGITKQEAADLIHSELPKMRGETVAFLQGVRQAATTDAP